MIYTTSKAMRTRALLFARDHFIYKKFKLLESPPPQKKSWLLSGSRLNLAHKTIDVLRHLPAHFEYILVHASIPLSRL